MLVDVVGDADDVVLLAEVGDHGDLLHGVDLAEGVVGVVEHDSLGLGGEEGLQLGGVQLPVRGGHRALGLALKEKL